MSTPDGFGDRAQKSFDTVLIVIIVSSIASLVALVAVAFAVIKWLKKAKVPLISFNAPVTNGVSMPPAFGVIPDSQLEAATMEKFLNDIAREKPIRFSPQQLSTITHNYATRLGSGGFGVVYKGQFPNGVQAAVKVINRSLDKRAEEQFMAEVSTIGRTYHINLVRLYGFCFDASSVKALVYEYMENGSVDKYLFDKNFTLETGKLHAIGIGTAKGIAYLHEECHQRIIHYDIKPGNELLDANFSPKVADFGLAKIYDRVNTHVSMTGIRGTPGYAAPELWMPYPVTHKCDVYSFGMFLFELIGRRKNHRVIEGSMEDSQEWFPKWVWEKFEAGKLGDVASLFHESGAKVEGMDSDDKVERMAKVALWCVQYLPEARPQMSTVVRMLEGEVEIVRPTNPFQYLQEGGGGGATSNVWSEGSYSESDATNTAPLMKKYGIEITTSS